ncbi:amino acid/amide ABC transporter substrate-binding protein, HAAT family [Salinihabitans flavidus]|uniref:Amino acid/amide ABC transporter substrate-binding protein, HAAT family n=1 Tax=Salinihabitans flavidus TaxID=569882 RepID=A0A1H8RM01_9RHOB|nr:ABC transporter substrate-binding protein [Salinihabitans flavidus]SEO67204.1 amino acid/amide ABC transporter substrate-binding protein, HAAT family [Salinihabitans flavidus]
MTRLTRRHLLASAGAAASIPLFAPGIVRGQTAIPIGLVTPLSGPQQLIGDAVRVGAEIAVEGINEAGGIDGRQVALEIRDSKANPNDATVAARELTGAGVNLQLGAISSTVALAMGTMMEGEGGIMITSGAGSEKINHENYSPHVFRVGDNPYTRAHGMVQHVADTQPDVNKWVGIIPDHEYGRTTWAVFIDAMAKRWEQTTGNRPEIPDPILVPYGAGDYKTFIAQATRLKPQGIFTSVYGGDAVTLYQQAKPFGLFDNLDVLVDSSNEFLVASAMGNQVPRGWTGFHWYYKANTGNPISDRLYDEYVNRTGSQYPLGWAAEAQAAVLAYKASIEKTGSTETQAVIDGLKGLTFDSATGPRTIRAEDNQAIKNAEMAFIEPSNSAEAGFEVTDSISIDGADVIEAANPGEKLELTTL